MILTITPARLAGAITPPPSKSQAHRAVLALALSGGHGTLHNLSLSQDILATRGCVAALKSARSAGADGLPLLDCRESGSTLRFLIPVALAVRGGGHFTGKGRLMERPQEPYFDIFREKGISWERAENTLTVRGTLPPGEYRLPGNVSSQFVTGLLYALPLLDGDSQIVLTSPLESRGYVDMTLEVLEQFGVTAENRNYERFLVPGNQSFQARDFTIEADWSQAAFWYAALLLGGDIKIEGLNPFSTQGDMVIAAHFARLSRPGEAEIDVSQCPDLVPALALMAALRDGQTTRIVNAARLRAKESDRLAAVTAELNALGAQVEEGPDFLVIRGVESLRGGRADAHNDHRIAMMLAIAATRASGKVVLSGAESVNKSYPDFWGDYAALGGQFVGGMK